VGARQMFTHLDGTLDGVQRLRAAVAVRGLDEPGRQARYGCWRRGAGGGGGAGRGRRRPAAEQTCGPRSACLSGDVLFTAQSWINRRHSK